MIDRVDLLIAVIGVVTSIVGSSTALWIGLSKKADKEDLNRLETRLGEDMSRLEVRMGRLETRFGEDLNRLEARVDTTLARIEAKLDAVILRP